MEESGFAERGKNVLIYPYVVWVKPETIHLKNQIIISEFAWILGGIKTLIGNFIHVSPYSSIVGGGVCILEDFVGLSAGARIITGSEMVEGEGLTNPTIPLKYRAVERSFVHCERHVFLGTNVVIHPGVTIGEGAVIGSNSVVTKDVDPWTINIGTPSRIVRSRKKARVHDLGALAYEEKGIQPTDISRLLPLKKRIKTLPSENVLPGFRFSSDERVR
jgi:acetyltransferase-like isoleucine patch superfamily enzyme